VRLRTIGGLYREAVHRELGAEPDPAIQKLEQALRAIPSAAVAAAPPTVPLLRDVPPKPQATPPNSEPAAPPVSRWIRWLIPATILGIVVVVLAWRRVAPSSATLPFLAVGEIRTEAPTDTTRLGPILRDMLATSLGGIEGLEVVANSRLVELMPRGPETSPGMIRLAVR
jgi:hypothetical protein